MLRSLNEQIQTGDFGRGDVLKTAAIVSMASVVTAAYIARVSVESARDFVNGHLNGAKIEKTPTAASHSSVLLQSLDGLGVEW